MQNPVLIFNGIWFPHLVLETPNKDHASEHNLNIINLGPYQPSNEVMLKFYGYYKQATEGPCNDIKPNFWDVIRRAKWEAWHKLGIMEEEEAMTRYVDELKQVHTAKSRVLTRLI